MGSCGDIPWLIGYSRLLASGNSSFLRRGESWEHVRSTVLIRYAKNTAFILCFSVLLAVLIGVAGAWCVERYHFLGRRVLSVLFLTPLALPNYIATFTYGDMLGYGGSLYAVTGGHISFAGIPAVVFILGFGLYPYVFMTVWAALRASSGVLAEVTASLSKRKEYRRNMLKGLFPSLRPAVVGGASLVAMEVMNAYATPLYLGAETFSTGVFSVWFGLGDLQTARLIAAIVFLGMLSLLLLEWMFRGRRRYSMPDTGSVTARKAPSNAHRVMIGFILLLPPFFGFLLPVSQLAAWTIGGISGGFSHGVGAAFLRSVLLAGGTSCFILGIAMLINFAVYLRGGFVLNAILRLAGIGYAIPGTVTAIGILVVFQNLMKVNVFLFGTIAGLLFAYVCRFLAVAVQPVHAAFAQQHRNTIDAARSLRSRPRQVLGRVVLPLFKPIMASVLLFAAIDVLQDLPISLLLRPFNFRTLATQVYVLASDERLAEASLRALLLVVVGLLTIAILSRPLWNTKQEEGN